MSASVEGNGLGQILCFLSQLTHSSFIHVSLYICMCIFIQVSLFSVKNNNPDYPFNFNSSVCSIFWSHPFSLLTHLVFSLPLHFPSLIMRCLRRGIFLLALIPIEGSGTKYRCRGLAAWNSLQHSGLNLDHSDWHPPNPVPNNFPNPISYCQLV